MGYNEKVELVAGATSAGKAEDAPHASGDTGVAILGVAQNTTPGLTVSAAGDYSPIITDSEGKTITAGTGAPAATRNGHVALTTTSDVSLIASAGSGLRHYVCDVTVDNTGAAAVRFILKDGTTAFWSCTVPANSSFTKSWKQPYRGAATTALQGALGAAGTATVSVTTYIGT